MTYAIYTGVVVGGTGPDTWEEEIEVDGDSWPLAAQSGAAQAEDMRGYLFSLELDVIKTGEFERKQKADLVSELRQSAAPKTHVGDCMVRAADEIERLRDGIDAIHQYGSDTLTGPTDNADDNREWQREAVLEMTMRASCLKRGEAWKTPTLEEQEDG